MAPQFREPPGGGLSDACRGPGEQNAAALEIQRLVQGAGQRHGSKTPRCPFEMPLKVYLYVYNHGIYIYIYYIVLYYVVLHYTLYNII